jgi:hypothetical protein
MVERSARVPARPSSPQPNQLKANGGSPSVVLIDGSALYMATRALYEDRHLDYHGFVSLLAAKVGVQPAGVGKTRWVMWTSASPQNAGQSRFLDFAKKELRLEVRPVSPSDSFIVEPNSILDASSSTKSRLVRFDASIAFAMGRLAEEHRIVVVSDSFPLAQPLLLSRRLALDRDPPALAFFGRALDNRWQGLLRREPDTLEFIDLDDSEEALFGGLSRPVEERRKPESTKDVF